MHELEERAETHNISHAGGWPANKKRHSISGDGIIHAYRTKI
jgi:hypothetical protein